MNERMTGTVPAAPPAAAGLSAVGRAAVDYVARWRWPLMVGAIAPPAGCGRPGGLGVDGGVLEPTTDPRRVRDWWTQAPHAGIVVETGQAFDLVAVPVDTGRRVLEELTGAGALLAPMMSDDDTVSLLVATGQEQAWSALMSALAADRGAGYAHLGAGQLAVLPPASPPGTGPVRWVVPPTDANAGRFPHFEELHRLLDVIGAVTTRPGRVRRRARAARRRGRLHEDLRGGRLGDRP